MRAEHTITQEWIRGAAMPLPACPSLVEILVAAAQKARERKPKPEPGTTGFRNNNTGNGRCGKCLKLKKSHEFASPTGQICKTCKKQSNTRGPDTAKRATRRP